MGAIAIFRDMLPFYSITPLAIAYLSSIVLALPTTGGDENYFMPALYRFFLFRFYLKAMPPPPALLMLPYFLVVFTSKVR